MIESNTDDLKKTLISSRAAEPVLAKKDLLSTGSTLINLACTGYTEGGFLKGHYYFWVGDSASGKTFFARTCLAEATINPEFDDYRLIYDDVEGGALMDTVKFFGQRLADRMEPPATDDDGNSAYSDTIEEFYYNIDDALQLDKPFIYVLDSMDALGSMAEQSKFSENKKDARAGKELTGSYGDGKAKVNSANMRRTVQRLRCTSSILLILNQTRDNPAAGPYQPTKTRSGGRALTFYATVELWSQVGKAISRTIKKKDRKIGAGLKIHIKKNRTTGKDRTIDIPIYYSIGIDDIGSCVNYLVSENVWPTKNGFVSCTDFDFRGRIEEVINFIESKGLIDDVKDIVKETWDDIEAACVVNRKNRYE